MQHKHRSSAIGHLSGKSSAGHPKPRKWVHLASYVNKRQKTNRATQILVFPSFHLSLQRCCFNAGFRGDLYSPVMLQQQPKGSCSGLVKKRVNSLLPPLLSHMVARSLGPISSCPGCLSSSAQCLDQPHQGRQVPSSTRARSLQGKKHT